jgi:Tfp pilus assembly protein PilW
MKLTRHAKNRDQQAMTLVEVMVASAIMVFVLGGFMAMNIFALRYNGTMQLKLQACNDARNAINQVATDIRSAGLVRVGNGNASSFTETGFGQRQQGNAIQLYPSKLNTNNYIVYYCDVNDQLLNRAVSASNVVVLARAVTNSLVFTSENFRGQVLSNNFNNRVIGVFLQFQQAPSPGGTSQRGFLYDYYQIHTRVTRRALE